MSKKRPRHSQESPLVYKERRMPKEWIFIGSNEMAEPVKTYFEKQRDNVEWIRLGIEAEQYNRQLVAELIKRKKLKIESEEITNEEILVEKKYRKDKTHLKFS